MISIIVPIYNVEKYLAACIDSILASTYQDFELILVDDGSPDHCGSICDSYAARDSRIKVIHKQNGGLSQARNDGMKVAKGEYVAFVDGDDVIHPQMIETLKIAIESGDYDFSMVRGVMLTPSEAAMRLQERNIMIDTASWCVLDQATCINNVISLDTGYQFDVVWNKLYRRDLIDGLFFKDTAGEDFEWSNQMYLRAHLGIDTGAELYYYIQREGSIMYKGLDSTYIGRINSYCECYDEMPADKKNYKALSLKAIYSFMIMVREKARKTSLREEAESCCADVYKKTRADLWRSELSFSRKLRYECFYHVPWLYRATVWCYYNLKGIQ